MDSKQHTYIFEGKVVHGEGYGRKLGFPTVNIHIQDVEHLPPGVYSGEVSLDDKEYKAGIVISPTEKIESHLIGYSGNAYGKIVKIKINQFLRKHEKFASEAELIAQIKKDISQC